MTEQCPKCFGNGFIKVTWEAEPPSYLDCDECDLQGVVQKKKKDYYKKLLKKRTVASVCNSFDKAIANAQDKSFKLLWWKKKIQFINKYSPKLLTYNNNFNTIH